MRLQQLLAVSTAVALAGCQCFGHGHPPPRLPPPPPPSATCQAMANLSNAYSITLANAAGSSVDTGTITFVSGYHHNIVRIIAGPNAFTLDGDCGSGSSNQITITFSGVIGSCAAGTINDVWTFSPLSGTTDAISIQHLGSCWVTDGAVQGTATAN